MARIWQEGFESGLPQGDYLEGGNGNYGDTQFINKLSMPNSPRAYVLGPGRSTFSNYGLTLKSIGSGYGINRSSLNLNEFYFRLYYKPDNASGVGYFIIIRDNSGNILCGIYHLSNVTSYELRVNINGVLTTVGTVVIQSGFWNKIEIYLKLNSVTGAYEFRINDINVSSNSGINTGSVNVASLSILTGSSGPTFSIDDIALNDTTGSVNNSWCGDGTIISLKPKGNGNSSQWDTSQGWVKAESGTTTTTLKITGHGLATNDVIYNKTRNAYRIVTVSDIDTLTVASVTGQTPDDIIVGFTYQSTLVAASGTGSDIVASNDTDLQSYDVIVNTSRGDAIRRIIFIYGNLYYVQDSTLSVSGYYGGSSVSGQTSGDSIKTFKVKHYPITNHWETVSKFNPNPQLSHIKTLTLNQIDLFNMQEVVADLGLPNTSQIVSVGCNYYAKDAGTGGATIKPVLRSGTTNNEGDNIVLTAQTLEHQQIYNTSPFTSSSWTLSEVDGLEMGMKSV